MERLKRKESKTEGVIDLTSGDDDPPLKEYSIFAKKKKVESKKSHQQTADKIIDAVVGMGFDRAEALNVLESMEEKTLEGLDSTRFVDLLVSRAKPSPARPAPAAAPNPLPTPMTQPGGAGPVSPSKPLASIFLRTQAKAPLSPQKTPSSPQKMAIDVEKPLPITLSPKKPVHTNITADTDLQKKFRAAHPAVTWSASEPVPYSHLSRLFTELEQLSARLRMTDLLTELFLCVLVMRPDDLLHSYYLCSRHIAPPYSGIQLGVGESVVMRGISAATGRTTAALVTDLHTLGDLGDVAQASRCTQRLLGTVPPLTVPKVFSALRDIATMKGHASMNTKVGAIQKLLTSCREEEAKYLVRTITGNLRIGVLERTLVVGLARAAVLCELMTTGKLEPENSRKHMQAFDESKANGGAASKSAPAHSYGEDLHQRFQAAEKILKKAVNELPNYDLVIPALLKYGIDALPKHCSLTAGVPVRPMLAHPTKDLAELKERFGDDAALSCEFKYDGERAQIHCLADGTVKIFSRNCEESTVKFPDVVSTMASYRDGGRVTSFVLDAEVCAFDREKNELLSFQILSSRARKLVQPADLKTRLCVFVFDLLFLNGKSVLDEPLSKRRALLREHFKELPGSVQYVRSIEVSSLVTDEEKLLAFLQSALEYKCEGLMLKSLVAPYEPSKRSLQWLKLKKDYMEGGGDTFDLVVIGAFHGRGRRAGWFGSYLLAVYDDSAEEYQAVCKCMTGFTDAFLEEASTKLRENLIAQPKPYYRPGGLIPDVWVEPILVWEIIAAGMSLSPVAQAAIGLVDSERGISLRFPRFKRQRDDKGIHDATTGRQLAQMYRSQNKGAAAAADEEDDVYDDD